MVGRWKGWNGWNGFIYERRDMGIYVNFIYFEKSLPWIYHFQPWRYRHPTNYPQLNSSLTLSSHLHPLSAFFTSRHRHRHRYRRSSIAIAQIFGGLLFNGYTRDCLIMLRRLCDKVCLHGVGKIRIYSFAQTASLHNGMAQSAPRSFFGVEDYVDDDNSRPYTYQKEKKSKNLNKHVSFKKRTIAFMEPFTLDVLISKRVVSASITHRVTCKQVATAGTNSKDIKAALKSQSDIPACLAIGNILAERAREADVYTASYTPRDRDKFEGKIRAVVQSLIDNGIDVKVYLD